LVSSSWTISRRSKTLTLIPLVASCTGCMMAALSRVISQRCRSVLGCCSLLKFVLINSRISCFDGRCSLGFQSSSGDLFLCIAVFPSWSNGCNTSVTLPTLWFTGLTLPPYRLFVFSAGFPGTYPRIVFYLAPRIFCLTTISTIHWQVSLPLTLRFAH
jgi:hypothetical protein